MKALPEDPNVLLEMVEVSPAFTTTHDEFSRVYRFVQTPDSIECQLFGAFPDVYEGITLNVFQHDENVVALGVSVQGWATPTDPTESNVPISERPDRKRVALVLVVDHQNRHASRLFFIDEGHSLGEEDGGASSGQLLDGLRTALHLVRLDESTAHDFVSSTLRDILDLNGDDSPF